MVLLERKLRCTVTAVFSDGLASWRFFPLVRLQIPQLVGPVKPWMTLNLGQHKFFFQFIKRLLFKLIKLLITLKYFPPLFFTSPYANLLS
jgi:hypothetical protein